MKRGGSWKKGQTGNPGGGVIKESTYLFQQYFNEGRCTEMYAEAFKLAKKGDSKLLCKILDKLVPNKQAKIEIVQDNPLIDLEAIKEMLKGD